MKTKNIRQAVSFKASPHALYETLMDSKRHAKFSGAPARMSRAVGAKFACYGGWVQGKNLELVPDRLIVQAWRGRNWPKGHYSTATFLFTKTKTGTKLTFGHSGIPAREAAHIGTGWKAQYWDKMKVALGEKRRVGKKRA